MFVCCVLCAVWVCVFVCVKVCDGVSHAHFDFHPEHTRAYMHTFYCLHTDLESGANTVNLINQVFQTNHSLVPEFFFYHLIKQHPFQKLLLYYYYEAKEPD
jgi:hypothetical protein